MTIQIDKISEGCLSGVNISSNNLSAHAKQSICDLTYSEHLPDIQCMLVWIMILAGVYILLDTDTLLSIR